MTDGRKTKTKKQKDLKEGRGIEGNKKKLRKYPTL
jgi:hypothetical protein